MLFTKFTDRLKQKSYCVFIFKVVFFFPYIRDDSSPQRSDSCNNLLSYYSHELCFCPTIAQVHEKTQNSFISEAKYRLIKYHNKNPKEKHQRKKSFFPNGVG